jgi:predicted DNA binding protein
VLAALESVVGGSGSVELDNAFYVEDGEWMESLTVASATPDEVIDRLDGVSGVSVFHVESIPSGPTETSLQRVVLFAKEPYPFVLEMVLRRHAIPNRVVLQDGQVTVIATVAEWEDFREMADGVEEKLGTFELSRVNEKSTPGEPLDSGRLSAVLVSKLTDEQLDVLETAYSMGYFEVPREASAREVAERLGIQQSTFSERIRTAEAAFLDIVFAPR